MNALLTDVKAPAKPASTAPSTPTTDTTSDTGKKKFSSMMQNNLQPESKNKPQLVENNKEIGGSVTSSELSTESSLVPDFWVEHLATGDTEAISEASLTIQTTDEIVKSEFLSDVVTPISSDTHTDTKSNAMSTTLPVVGETLPANGNSLPLFVDQTRPAGSISNIRVKGLQQTPQIGAFVQNNGEEFNGSRGAVRDTAQFDSKSQFTSSDLLDSLTSKTFELNALQQTATDSSSARLQAAMSAINGIQNPSANPGTANPVASTSVLSNSLERMVMTNPDSSAEWGSGLGERVSVMLNQKQNAATIRLDPPMLGKMDIQIQVKDDVTNVTINTQHAQTRDMVDSASQRLREFLQDAGYQNVNVDVSHQSDQQKNDAQFMAEPGSTDDLDSEPTQGIDELTMTTQASISNSLVDYFA